MLGSLLAVATATTVIISVFYLFPFVKGFIEKWVTSFILKIGVSTVLVRTLTFIVFSFFIFSFYILSKYGLCHYFVTLNLTLKKEEASIPVEAVKKSLFYYVNGDPYESKYGVRIKFKKDRTWMEAYSDEDQNLCFRRRILYYVGADIESPSSTYPATSATNVSTDFITREPKVSNEKEINTLVDYQSRTFDKNFFKRQPPKVDNGYVPTPGKWTDDKEITKAVDALARSVNREYYSSIYPRERTWGKE